LVRLPKIVFLDQNKWIDLTRAFVDAHQDSPLYALGMKAREAVIEGRVLFPLTASLIIETYKMKNLTNRGVIAETQAKFSQGYIFRERATRIRREAGDFIAGISGLSVLKLPSLWWLSKYFIEAFVDLPQAVRSFGVQLDQIEGMQADPKYALYHWLSNAPREEQSQAISAYDIGSDAVIDRIMFRVSLVENENFSVRRKAYSANLALDELPRICEIAHSIGVDWNGVSDIGSTTLKRMMVSVPTYHAEIELASRIESLDRAIVRNDLRDMESYVSAIPYANVIVGENLFVNIAKQAGLDKKFGCLLTTNLMDLTVHL
jgi:hypothetical protein